MSEEIRVSNAGGYLLVEFLGEFGVEAGKRCVDRMASACKEHRCTKILLDCRQMTGDMPIFNRFQVVEYGASVLFATEKFALLVRPEVALPDKFVENAAVNRGMNLRVVTEFDDAVQWLSEPISNMEGTTAARSEPDPTNSNSS